jgi:hypothetical protein
VLDGQRSAAAQWRVAEASVARADRGRAERRPRLGNGIYLALSAEWIRTRQVGDGTIAKPVGIGTAWTAHRRHGRSGTAGTQTGAVSFG